MSCSTDNFDLSVVPAGTGFLIFAFTADGHEIGSAMLEIAHPHFFREGHGYFMEREFPSQDGFVAVVSSLYVNSESMGRGIGRAILRKAESIAGKHECDWIYVHASDVGRGDPSDFYRACGFEPVVFDDTCLRKKVCAENPAATTVSSTIDFVGKVFLSPVRFWTRQCSSATECGFALNHRLFKNLLGT